MSIKGETLFEIETDKAAMEVDAPASGVLKFVAASEGDVLPVGTCIGWIVAEGESFAPPVANARAASARSPARGARPRPAEGSPGCDASAATAEAWDDARLSTAVEEAPWARTRSASARARRPPPGAWRASADCSSRA